MTTTEDKNQFVRKMIKNASKLILNDNPIDTLIEIQNYMIDKQAQDKLWNELSEESKKYIISLNKELEKEYEEYKKDCEDNLASYSLEKAIMLESLFGEHNLNPQSPTPKTWEDVEKEHPEYRHDISDLSKIAYVDMKILCKLIATYKIAKLIELGYGGMVSEEEWKDEDIRKFSIVRFQENLSYAEGRGAYEFVSFHTPEQREEFMSHESNRKLVEMYYCL